METAKPVNTWGFSDRVWSDILFIWDIWNDDPEFIESNLDSIKDGLNEASVYDILMNYQIRWDKTVKAWLVKAGYYRPVDPKMVVTGWPCYLKKILNGNCKTLATRLALSTKTW